MAFQETDLTGTASDFSIYSEGDILGPEDAVRLEHDLKISPSNLHNRLPLLWYYAQQAADLTSKDKWLEHVKWLIRERPTDWITGNLSHHPALSKSEYSELETLFRSQNLGVPIICGRAGQFFERHNPLVAEQFICLAEKLQPRNPEWSNSLALIYMLLADQGAAGNKYVRMAIRAGERAISKENHPGEREGLFERLSNFSFAHGEYVLARRYCRRRLKHAVSRQIDWNQHHALTLMGEIAIQMGEMGEAEKSLLKSAELDDFTPSVDLANKLLDLGKRDVVFSYLNICTLRLEHHREQIKGLIARLSGDESFRLSIDPIEESRRPVGDTAY